MSDISESLAPPPSGRPPRASLAPPPRGSAGFLGCAFALSFAVNLIGVLLLILGCLGSFTLHKTDKLSEQHYSGKKSASDKIAIISLDGVIVEGLLGYVRKQIDQAADDDSVKAVVVRINSPGGSITASDDVHRRLTELRDGNDKKKNKAKPLLVSMGGLAASGGYYVAMPAQTIFAERTTMTGSIGVYSSFPNVKKLADQYGVSLQTIKQGQIKDSGSPFADMTAHEKQVWQDTIDTAYQRFLAVVEEGRPKLSGGKLLEPLTITPLQAGPAFLKKDKKKEPYKRYLADGGIWLAAAALKHHLIDKIGTLDDAVQAAHDAANLGADFRAIKYERPSSLADLIGISVRSRTTPAGTVLDPACLEAAFRPRMWYLAPGAEVSGFFAAAQE